MSTETHTRRPENIQADIDQNRSELDKTLWELQNRFSPNQLFDQALRYFRDSDGDGFMLTLKRTVKRNPVPVTLLGVSLAWLMMSDSEKEGRRPHLPEHEYDPDYDPDYDSDHLSSTDPNPYGQAGYETTEPVFPEAQARPSGDTGSGVRQKAAEVTNKMRDKVRGQAQTVGEKASGTAQGIRKGTARATEGVRRQGARLQAQARYGVESGERYFNRLLQEQPLVLGALGVALGAALGTALPPTRREDELMGASRDELLSEAKQTAREQVAKAQRSAEAAADAAVEQAEQEGLTQENLREQVQEVRAKAGRVAESAREAGKEETKRQGMPEPDQNSTKPSGIT